MYILSSKIVKIKKERICYACEHKYIIGSLMTYIASVQDRCFDSTYWCETCHAFLNSSSDSFEDGIQKGEFRGEYEYEKFKKNYLSPTRNVILEKIENPCIKIQLKQKI